MNSKILLSTVALMASVSSAYSQNILKGVVTDKDEMPITGANLRWLNTTVGAVTDIDGNYEIPSVSGNNVLIVSYIGYQNDTIKVSDYSSKLNVVLAGELALNEVIVSERRMGTISSKIEPIQTQKITYDELCRAACCNLAESFETNPSVDVTYSDAATGARQIRLLGLAGTYVQMMTEQIPNLQGAASSYGLSYVPGPWMESINVSKGTSSVKNGYEALTGQINVEYKKPQTSDPLSVNLFAAHTGRLEANVDANITISDKLATGTLLHYSREQESHDDNNDGFLDMPKTEQFNGIHRWYYKGDRFIHQTLANVMHEKRESGQVDHAGSHGSSQPQMAQDPYKINIETNRGVLFTKNGYILNKEKNTSIALMLSGIYHNQESNFGNTLYDVNQKNVYANLVFETEFTQAHKISTGVSFNHDGYTESLNDKYVSGLANLDLRRNLNTAGAYFQYTFMPSDKLTFLAGVRADNNNVHGTFFTPRVHIKYSPFGDYLSLRASAGKGYRMANVLVENSYLLASSRQMNFTEKINPMEEAWNYGLSAHSTIDLFDKPLSVMLEWYYTDFQKQVVADMEDPHAVNFYNLDGRSYAQNAQIEVSYPFFRGFTLTGAYRITDAKTTYGDELKEKPLTNRYKALLTASYQTRLKKWQFDVTSSFNGKGRMPNPGADALWDEYFPSYISLNAQITKYFRTWSIYVGGENLTGYKQKNPDRKSVV